jgi:hypothetical protein
MQPASSKWSCRRSRSDVQQGNSRYLTERKPPQRSIILGPRFGFPSSPRTGEREMRLSVCAPFMGDVAAFASRHPRKIVKRHCSFNNLDNSNPIVPITAQRGHHGTASERFLGTMSRNSVRKRHFAPGLDVQTWTSPAWLCVWQLSIYNGGQDISPSGRRTTQADQAHSALYDPDTRRKHGALQMRSGNGLQSLPDHSSTNHRGQMPCYRRATRNTMKRGPIDANEKTTAPWLAASRHIRRHGRCTRQKEATINQSNACPLDHSIC